MSERETFKCLNLHQQGNRGGQKLHEQIETAIRVYDKPLIVISEASLHSEWVMTELRKARKAERQSGQRKLFPVRLTDIERLRDWECFDADSGKDLAVELREYFIPDFSHWKEHDQFETAFARLLKDLRAEESAKCMGMRCEAGQRRTPALRLAGAGARSAIGDAHFSPLSP